MYGYSLNLMSVKTILNRRRVSENLNIVTFTVKTINIHNIADNLFLMIFVS